MQREAQFLPFACLGYHKYQEMSIYYNTRTVRNGLLVQLDALNRKSYPGNGGFWYDLSGNENHFTMQGTPIFSNGFFELPGNNITDYFIRNPFNHPTVTSTIEIWAAANTSSSGDAYWSYAVSGYDNSHLLFDQSNLTLYVTTGNGSGYPSNISVADGRWRQIVTTSDRSSGVETLYVNGQQVYTDAIVAGSNFTSGGSMVIGQEQDSVGGGFNSAQAFAGKISAFMIYDRILSAVEVQRNFESLRGRYGI